MIGNVIWPFQKFGLGGCVVMFVYWPIALPLIGVICAFYYLPTIFLTVRMFFYSKRAFLRYRTQHSSSTAAYAVLTAVCLFVCLFADKLTKKLYMG